MTDIVIPLST
jgi:hypothetical protein